MFSKAGASLHVLTGYSCFSSTYSAHEQFPPLHSEDFFVPQETLNSTLDNNWPCVPRVFALDISHVNYLGGDFIPHLSLSENYFAKDTDDFVDKFVLETSLTYLSGFVLGNLGGE